MTAAVPNYQLPQITSEARRAELLIQSILLGVRTTTLVKVVAVHPGTGSPPTIGTVDVQPLVQSVDRTGKPWPLKTTYGVPFSRIQAGATAFILDPAEGDIGLAGASDRDISAVIASGGQMSLPGSARRYDISDLVYLFTVLSAVPATRYIWAKANGDISVITPGTLTLQAGQINMTGPINANGATISSAGEITDALGVVLGTHLTSGVTPGTGESGPPVPG